MTDLVIDLPQELIDALEKQAVADGLSFNDEVLGILNRYLLPDMTAQHSEANLER
jgi:plasmid stability protein